MLSTENGIRFYPTPVIDADWNTGNVMVSVPVTDADMVWAIADWFKTGPFTMPAKNGRIAASFKDVYVDEIEMLIGFINGHN